MVFPFYWLDILDILDVLEPCICFEL